jgi:small subunit ribosomal protein S18
MMSEVMRAEDKEGKAPEDSEQKGTEKQEKERRTAYTPRPRQERRPSGGRYQQRGGRRRFRPRRKVCSFCVDKVKEIDYKGSDALRRYLDGHGKIIPRRKTGTCAKHQRRLTLAIKRARHLALLPFAARRTPYS